MKKSWLIIIIAVVLIVVINEFNDEKNINLGNDDKNSVLEKEDTYTENTYVQNENNYDYIVESEYKYSKSGYLISGELEHRRYSLVQNDISLLNGFFLLKQSSAQDLFAMTVVNDFKGHYESKGLYKCDDLPLGLCRDNGDKLVIVGEEWGVRSEYEKSNMLINVNGITLLGYGKSQIKDGNISVDNMTSVNGITISPKISSSTSDKNCEQITGQLRGTDISCIYGYNVTSTYPIQKFLVSNKYNTAVTCEYYDGTQYGSTTFNLNEPFILLDDEKSFFVPVQPTQNGYFIVDVSSLPSGIYAIKKSVYPSGIVCFVVD